MDASTTETQVVNEPVKKTLMLDKNTVEWGEQLAELDHRGCLSNVVKWLIDREFKSRLKKESEEPALALGSGIHRGGTTV
jgi:hypothetical protein